MKKFRAPAALLFILLAFAACKKDEQATPGFDLAYTQQFDIPAGIGNFAVHHFYLKNIPSRYAQALVQQGKTDADVKGIITTAAVLSGVYGDADFSFVDQVSVRVYHESNPNDYIEVAYRQPVPLDPGNSLPLIPSLADSKRLVSADRYSVDVVLWLRSTTIDNTQAQLNLQFKAEY